MGRVFSILLICLSCVQFSFGALAVNSESDEAANVYVVELDSTINREAVSLIEKACREANLNMADLLIVEINTYGGYIDSAIAIKDLILTAPVTTVTFVNKQAFSAGSLIAVAGEKLYMSEGSTMGAAEAREGQEKADNKVTSAWVSELRSTAEARGKDPDIMAAMADDTLEIEGLVKKGELLSLTDAKALEYAISDGTVANYGEIAADLGVEMVGTQEVETNSMEKFATFVSNPIVSGVLLAIGIVGLLIAMLTGTFGISAVAALCALVVYFSGHLILDSTAWVAALLFMAGIILIMIEAFVAPGFGLPGVAGGISLVSGIVLLASSWQAALTSISVAIVLSCIIVVISMKNKKTRSVWKKFILHDKTDAESGYTAPNMDNISYLGKEGVTLTPLRPAGEVDIDGNRVDVVTEGNFLDAGTTVVVSGLDGTRIVVKEKRE